MSQQPAHKEAEPISKPYTQTTRPVIRCSRELYDCARELIPTGTMLLSKRPERHAPGCWPAYYKSAWGNKVEDVDGNVYTDWTGDVGATLLGRADPDVNTAVKAVVAQGFLSTGCHYLTLAHTIEDAEVYLSAVGCVLEELRASLKTGRLMEDIDHNPCRPDFKRLA